MLYSIFKNIITKKINNNKNLTEISERARNLMLEGKFRDALNIYAEYLKYKKDDASVINDIGVCHSEIGDFKNAKYYFELAFAIDDKYTPAAVNHAKFLLDSKNSKEAEYYLSISKIVDPKFNHTNAVYASFCLSTKADPIQASKHQLISWLNNFNNLRLANCFLFYNAYCNIDEKKLAAEHVFWAKTVEKKIQLQKKTVQLKKKIKIGYWSPDFKNHSVIFFFKPILENHNKNLFEIFIFDDTPTKDSENRKIKDKCDRYFDVFGLTDDELSALFIYHDLDILVEMAAHSSYNRISMLQHRYAKLQITGIGYPPTTGLDTIDAKILDKHLLTENYGNYYSEMPMILPNSFWCFDPMETAPANLEEFPPFIKNKYITFGCVGNIAKINEEILYCWKQILSRLPKSKLLIRSINFEDENSILFFKNKLQKIGLPINRISFKKPESGKNFFESYNDIDIILDTHPFNGGTTTCFAVYMGVPVITLSGYSLISRMGLSILKNLDAQKLITFSKESYISTAINISQDINFLKAFKKTSRKKMQETALGNGAIFTKDLEEKYIELLTLKESGNFKYKEKIIPLDEHEILRRAVIVMNSGQNISAKRIIDYCLKCYPNSSFSHILLSIQKQNTGDFIGAIEYLKEKFEILDKENRLAALISISRNYLLVEDFNSSKKYIKQIFNEKENYLKKENIVNINQCNLCISSLSTTPYATTPIQIIKCSIVIVVISNSIGIFNKIKQNIEHQLFSHHDINFEIIQSNQVSKIDTYKNLIGQSKFDYLFILQENIEYLSPGFFEKAIDSLKENDILGYCGGSTWKSLNWTTEDFCSKSGAFLKKSVEKNGWFDVYVAGSLKDKEKISFLAGDFIACKFTSFNFSFFDERYINASSLMEQIWTNDVYKKGGKLIVNNELGIVINQDIYSNDFDPEIVLSIAKDLNLEIFTIDENIGNMISWPVTSIADGNTLIRNFYST